MIPLVAPCITKHDRKYMVDRVTDGLLEDESEVARFEEAFAARVGCEWAVAVNSGTNALIVALKSVATWSGLDGEVAIQSYACTALRNAVQAIGYTPTYVDTNFDVQKAQAVIPRDQHANVLTHLFGQSTSGNTGMAVVADWTLSLGHWLMKHRYSSTAGVIPIPLGVVSTHASKMISTGRGGVIFGRGDEATHDEIRWLLDYESHTRFGYSFGMSSTQAALGVSQLGQLDAFIGRRRELATRYTDAFRAAGIDCPDADCGSVFFRYIIRVTDPALKVEALADRGIEAGRGVYPPLHRLAGLQDHEFPGTTAAVESLLSVPVHPSISDAQAGHIIESVLAVCAP